MSGPVACHQVVVESKTLVEAEEIQSTAESQPNTSAVILNLRTAKPVYDDDD